MKKNKIVLLLFIFILTFILPFFSITSLADTSITIYSPYCILMEASTGKIIYEKEAHAKVPPASTTKIMTAILTLEHCQLTDTATVSHNAIYSVPVGYTHANLVEGEVLTIDQLLHVLLIPSANDAANVLAEHISGSIANFSELMNKKAKEIGCKNSHFANPSGVHSTELYTTAYDLSLIARYAMNIEKFRQIITTTTYTLPSTELHQNSDRKFTTSNALIRPDSNEYYEYANGIKTGFTNPAKDCIVASAKKDNKEFIVVILGADYTDDHLRQKYVDCKTLFDSAFDNYIPNDADMQQQIQESSENVVTSKKKDDVIATNNGYMIFKFASRIVAVIVIIFAIRMIFVVSFKSDDKQYSRKRKHK